MTSKSISRIKRLSQPVTKIEYFVSNSKKRFQQSDSSKNSNYSAVSCSSIGRTSILARRSRGSLRRHSSRSECMVAAAVCA